MSQLCFDQTFKISFTWRKVAWYEAWLLSWGGGIVNSWAIHGWWLRSLYIKTFGMWTITSFTFSQSLLQSIKSGFCCFYQKYVVLFLLHLLHIPLSPPCCPVHFPSLIIKFPLLLRLLQPHHHHLWTIAFWLHLKFGSIGDNVILVIPWDMHFWKTGLYFEGPLPFGFFLFL